MALIRLSSIKSQILVCALNWLISGLIPGPGVAIQKLQTVLKIEPDGILGPKTIAAITASDPKWLNNKLALERVRMIGRIVQKNPAQAKSLIDWLNRALEFIVPTDADPT